MIKSSPHTTPAANGAAELNKQDPAQTAKAHDARLHKRPEDEVAANNGNNDNVNVDGNNASRARSKRGKGKEAGTGTDVEKGLAR